VADKEANKGRLLDDGDAIDHNMSRFELDYVIMDSKDIICTDDVYKYLTKITKDMNLNTITDSKTNTTNMILKMHRQPTLKYIEMINKTKDNVGIRLAALAIPQRLPTNHKYGNNTDLQGMCTFCSWNAQETSIHVF
jgi:hypothetical protein